jgi:hypothetical protein
MDMAGAVFFLVIVAILLVAFASVTPFILIPVVAIGLGLLVVPLVLAAKRGSSGGEPDPGPSGVPTTREASYDPVREP